MKSKIQVGQVWRNKEKNYKIKVIAKLKDDIWTVSAHGKGSTTHSMTENSFHFYELVTDDKPDDIKDKINITNYIRLSFNELEINTMFSVNDIVDLLIKNNELKNIKREKIKTSINAFISHSCAKTNIIKKHSNSRKVSTTKKVYQKLKNSDIVSKKKNVDIKIGFEFFKKVFDDQLEINESFDLLKFTQKVFTTFDGDKLDDEKKNIIKSRISSFINRYIKKGYIDRVSNTSQLIKDKNINNVFVEINDTQEDIQEDNQTVSEEKTETNSELNMLLKKFAEMPMGDLVESFIIYFNILQEKEKSHRKTIDSLKAKIKMILDDENKIDVLKDRLKTREDKIIFLNKENCSLRDKIKQLDLDVNHQLDENEKLQSVNNQLSLKKEEEITDAWTKLKISDLVST